MLPQSKGFLTGSAWDTSTVFSAERVCPLQSTGKRVYSNGGHNAPYMVNSGGEIHPLEWSGDMALGLFEEIEYKSRNITMKPGDVLVLYPDGVTEAMNRQEEFYMESHLEQVLRREYTSSAVDLTKSVLEDVGRLVDGYRQSDDIAVLTLKYLYG